MGHVMSRQTTCPWSGIVVSQSRQLKEKSNLIAYCHVCERAAAGIVVINYEPTGSNVADMLTKTQSAERTRPAKIMLC